MADRTMIIESVKFLSEYYGKELNTSQVQAYVIGLSDISERALEAATREVIKTSAFMPRVSELRKAAEPYRGLSGVDHTMVEYARYPGDIDGWAELSEQFRREGRYAMADDCILRTCRANLSDEERHKKYGDWGK